MNDRLLKKLRSQKWTADYKEGVAELKRLIELDSALCPAAVSELQWVMDKLATHCMMAEIHEQDWRVYPSRKQMMILVGKLMAAKEKIIL